MMVISLMILHTEMALDKFLSLQLRVSYSPGLVIVSFLYFLFKKKVTFLVVQLANNSVNCFNLIILHFKIK